tara:strand:- start:320 stop:1435 length:1116 start_codon:yes stop_codon:yes gene_type:complete
VSVTGRGRIVLRFDADGQVGMGHFSRSLSLAEKLVEIGFEPIVVTKHVHANIWTALKTFSYTCIKIPSSLPWSAEEEYIAQEFGFRDVKASIFDISTPYALCSIPDVDRCLSAFKNHGSLCLIDSVHDQALGDKIQTDLDMVVVPYVGSGDSEGRKQDGTTFLGGPSYFVLGGEYSRSGPIQREMRSDDPLRVLLTFGGSDPQGITARALKAVSRISEQSLMLRVIVGPSFSDRLTSQLEQSARSIHHCCTIVNAPDSLLEHMLWCDLAISSSGLTKYELAMTGTPSILISIDKDHALINKPFDETGVSVHLGVHSMVSEEQIKHAVVRLLANRDARVRMSRCGRELLDGQGATKILNELDSIISRSQERD